ncbi:phage tail protein [Novosphingobium resinovorum]|uniref:phage tail protein n=1 Tax=Novosphingobium resinovorum TaxID=158500 RepID=UPI002ED06203|nr:phage tail protein [Novosphingobium resinovorum]
MATLAFGNLGAMLGGPVGGAIGTLVGRQFDSALFGTSRRGARLKELAVTASSYGQTLPRHFGRMRTAGTVIWATDLVERSEVQGSGKGSPSVTTYSYSANFAVALASRPIRGIGRIWADGNLLRGAEGDLKAAGTLRIYTGAGDQPPDPLMLAAEGEALCPAYRGIAYVVFEDLDLSGFYNRIPSLTFEVIADDDFTLQDVIGDAIEAIAAEVPLTPITGYTSEADPALDLQTFDQIMPLEIDAAGDELIVARERRQGGAIALPEAAIATGDGDFGAASGFARQRAAPSDSPPSILRYYDLDRDYQASVQRATGRARQGEPGTIDLPAALDAASARDLIEQVSRRVDWSRDRISWRTCELDPEVGPGALVSLPGIAGHWRVREWEWRDSGVELTLERALPVASAQTPGQAADPGRANAPLDVTPGETRIVALELPCDTAAGSPDVPRTVAAVSGTTAAWTGAALYADPGDGTLTPLGPSGRARAALGTALTALPAASPLLFDRASQLVVSLPDPAMQLASVDTRQLAYGANLALVGEELVQFLAATPLGNGEWRLAGLLRGRGGTEAAIGAHAASEPFALLEAGLTTLNAATLGTDTARQVFAVGRGDADPVGSPVHLDGIGLRPLSPVHPRRTATPDGGLALGWTRRARGAWTWQDGVDAPLVEQAEQYLVTLGPIDSPIAAWTTTGTSLEIDAATIASLTGSAAGAALHVRQQGTHALSHPLPLGTLD